MAEGTRADNGGEAGKSIFSFDTDSGPAVANGPSAAKTDGAINPESLAGTGSGEPGGNSGTKRGRGRPKGSGTKAGAGAQKAPLDLGFVEITLLGIHTMLASHIQEMALTETEAHQLAVAINNVAQYYPIHVDPKMQAWMGLCMVAGSLYVPRAIAYAARVNTQPKEEAPPPLYNGMRAVS